MSPKGSKQSSSSKAPSMAKPSGGGGNKITAKPQGGGNKNTAKPPPVNTKSVVKQPAPKQPATQNKVAVNKPGENKRSAPVAVKSPSITIWSKIEVKP